VPITKIEVLSALTLTPKTGKFLQGKLIRIQCRRVKMILKISLEFW